MLYKQINYCLRIFPIYYLVKTFYLLTKVIISREVLGLIIGIDLFTLEVVFTTHSIEWKEETPFSNRT